MPQRLPMLIACIAFAGLLCGCSTPSQRYEQRAGDLGLKRTTITSTQWQLAVYDNQAVADPKGRLHVYFEGDGTPWYGAIPAADPTPRRPVALELLALDPHRAVVIGRPCYHNLRDQQRCDDAQWTSHRYSSEIVESLAQAIPILMQSTDLRSVVLIGYSGGGVLAQLVGARIDHVDAVITIGANLDTQAWSAHHGYLPLSGSLNPARIDGLRDTVHQHHFIGANDTVVPLVTRVDFFARHRTAKEHVIDTFGHVCCWTRDWPTRLTNVLDPQR